MAKPLSICYILSSLHLSGGVRVVIQYANHLVKRGYQLSLVVPNGTISSDVKQEIDIKVKIIQAKISLEKSMNPVKLLRLAWEMAKVVPQSDFIIATHTPTTVVSYIAGRIFKSGKILWFNQDYLEMFDERPIENWLLRNASRWHELVLTQSEACFQELQSYFPGRIINIGLGVDNTNVYHPLPDVKRISQVSPDKKVVFFIGDTRPRKGLSDFITAAEKVFNQEPNLSILIASKEYIKLQTNVPCEFFLCPSDDELVRLYVMCDVFVSASWYEGFGLPPLEAMACGAAVVTTDSRGVREFAVNRDNCLLVPPKDPEALAEAILLLLSNSELADQLRKNGLVTASNFNWDTATNRLESALLTLNT